MALNILGPAFATIASNTSRRVEAEAKANFFFNTCQFFSLIFVVFASPDLDGSSLYWEKNL